MSFDDLNDGANLPAVKPEGTGAARALMSRDAHEIMGLVMVSQRLPRDVVTARTRIADAFKRPKLAEQAQYLYFKGGTEVVGPSIRAAEAIAQHWGRVNFGFRVLGETVGADGVTVSEVRAYALDYESVLNVERIFNVRHWRATRQGGYKLNDDREVSELIANLAQRRTRACILAVIPSDVIEDAMATADQTLVEHVDTTPAALERMVDAFAQFGVDQAMIERRIQRNLLTIRPRQKIDLTRIWVSLRDGASRPANWFQGQPERQRPATHADAVREAMAATKPDPRPAPVATPADAPEASSPDTGPPAAPKTEDTSDAPRVDVPELLKAIRAVQTLEDLQQLDDLVGAMPEGSDKTLLIEALRHRDSLLSSGEN